MKRAGGVRRPSPFAVFRVTALAVSPLRTPGRKTPADGSLVSFSALPSSQVLINNSSPAAAQAPAQVGPSRRTPRPFSYPAYRTLPLGGGRAVLPQVQITGSNVR